MLAKRSKTSFFHLVFLITKEGLTLSTQRIIQNSIAYMEQHLEEQLTLAEIAAHAGFSPYHFHRLFRKEVGMNIADYLRKRRLCYAAQLLLHTEAAIIDISLHCHFESQESFTRAFKNYTACRRGVTGKSLRFTLITQANIKERIICSSNLNPN